jgi:hypothetical protein
MGQPPMVNSGGQRRRPRRGGALELARPRCFMRSTRRTMGSHMGAAPLPKGRPIWPEAIAGGRATTNEGEGRGAPGNGQVTSSMMMVSASSEEAQATRSTVVVIGRTSGGRSHCRRLDASGVGSFHGDTLGGAVELQNMSMELGEPANGGDNRWPELGFQP